jgi:uncharacterized protein with FMN-binding domain
MRRKQWRGTILFAAIMVVMGATVGLRLYDVGQPETVSSATSVSSAPSQESSSTSSSTTSSGSSTASGGTATPSPATATKTLTGAVEENRYGRVQVEVTFQGTKITAVQVLQSPGDRRSVQINARATPILEQEVLSSQSANIDTVSGATYTSDSYQQSVQSAIDQL